MENFGANPYSFRTWRLSGSPFTAIATHEQHGSALQSPMIFDLRSTPAAGQMPDAAISKASGLIEWQRQRITRYIDKNLAFPIDNLTLSALARRSVGHFHRAFKQTFGRSPQSYIMECRLDKAVRQMQLTDQPLAIIAEACGFTDQSHLNRLFRARYGTPPAHWRRTLAE